MLCYVKGRIHRFETSPIWVCNFLFGELMNSNRSQEKTVFRLWVFWYFFCFGWFFNIVLSTRVCVCWEVNCGGWECPSQQRFSQSDLAGPPNHPHIISSSPYIYAYLPWRSPWCKETSVSRSFVDLDQRFSDISGKGWGLRTDVLLPAEAGPQGLRDEHWALCVGVEGRERPGRMEHCLCPGKASSTKDTYCLRKMAKWGIGHLMCNRYFWSILRGGGVLIDYNMNIPWYPWKECSSLGKPVHTKTDEFPENFQTASDPPAPFSEKNIAIFSANRLCRH